MTAIYSKDILNKSHLEYNRTKYSTKKSLLKSGSIDCFTQIETKIANSQIEHPVKYPKHFSSTKHFAQNAV